MSVLCLQIFWIPLVFFFLPSKNAFLSIISWALDIWRASVGTWGVGQALNCNKDVMCHFCGVVAASCPPLGVAPQLICLCLILYVLYVCIIQWSQEDAKTTRELGEKNPPPASLHLPWVVRTWEGVDGLFRDLMYISDLAPIRLHWLLGNHQNCFLGRAGF